MGALFCVHRIKHPGVLRSPGHRFGGLLGPEAHRDAGPQSESSPRGARGKREMRRWLLAGRGSPLVRPSFAGTAALGSIALGTSVAVYNMFDWSRHQHYFAQTEQVGSSVLYFYLAQSISIFLLLFGFHLARVYLRRRPADSSLLSIV